MRDVLEVRIIHVVIHVVDVDTPRSDRGGLEETAQELGHLPSRDHTVGREARLRGPLGDPETSKLVDGVPDVTRQTADIPEALIGSAWNHDAGRPRRP